MHSQQVYHRDMKTDNVLIHQQPFWNKVGQFKVGDFGLVTRNVVGNTYCGTEGAQCQLGGCLTVGLYCVQITWGSAGRMKFRTFLLSSNLSSFVITQSSTCHQDTGPGLMAPEVVRLLDPRPTDDLNYDNAASDVRIAPHCIV